MNRQLGNFWFLILMLLAVNAVGQTNTVEEYKLVPFHGDSLWGYSNTQGEIVLEPRFDFAAPFELGLAQVQVGNEKQLINSIGEVITKENYQTLNVLDSSLVRMVVGRCGTGIINNNGDVIIPPEFSIISHCQDRLIGVKNGGYYFFDEKGTLLTTKLDYGTTSYGSVVTGFGTSNYGDAVIVFRDDKTGVLRYDGVEIIPPIFDWIPDFFDSPCIPVQKDGKWGVYDREGTAVIPLELDSIVDWYYKSGDCNTPMVAQKDNKYGIITKSGTQIVDFKYDEMREMRSYGVKEKIFLVRSDGKSGVIDSVGNILVPLEMDIGAPRAVELNRMGEEQDRRFLIRVDGLIGVIDLDEGVLLHPKYSNLGKFTGGIAQVWNGGKIGFIDSSWNEVLPPQYDRVNQAQNGLIQVYIDKKVGLLDSQYRELLPPVYDRIERFKNGFAKVHQNGKVGYVSEGGVEVIKCKYDVLGEVENGLAAVYSNNRNSSSAIPGFGHRVMPIGYVGVNGIEYFDPSWID